MPSTRTLGAALAAALILPVLGSTATTTATGAPAATANSVQIDSTAALRVRQRATLFMHPQISDPGSGARSANKARSAMTAQFKPRKKGRPVLLQKKKGTSWVTIKKARQNGQGRVEFVAPFQVRRKVQTYRVVATRYDGLATKASKARSANWWSKADLDEPFTSSMGQFRHRQTDYTGMRECAASHADNLKLVNGTLRLTVDIDQDGKPDGDVLTDDTNCETSYGTYKYRHTAQASTEGLKAFRYGYAAARIKFQKEAGQHGAFWLQRATADPEGTEIDVIEWFGDRAKDSTELTSFVQRTWTEPPVKDKTCGLISNPGRYGSDWYGKFHVFSVEWTPSWYVFRIDGKETCRTNQLRSETAEFLVLSLQANNYELKYSKTLPQHMYVDWVRFWDRSR